MKNTLEEINSRITEAEERISDLEDRKAEFTAVEQNKEKRMKRNEDSLKDFWDNIKCDKICIIGVLEEEEKEKGPKKISEEIIVEKFPNMGKEIATQVQEAQRVPYRINPRRNTPRHTVIKVAKIKNKGSEKIFEITAENFPKMGKDIVNQVQEVQKVPNRINPMRNMPRHKLYGSQKKKRERKGLRKYLKRL